MSTHDKDRPRHTAREPNGNHSLAAELALLSGRLGVMGGLAEAQLEAALDALTTRDTEGAAMVVAGDEAVDDLETEVNSCALRLLTLYAPVAADLREIVAALKISAGIERIGDYAVNVAKRSMIVNEYPAALALGGVTELGHLVRQYVQNTFDAYAERDISKAEAVWRCYADIESLHTSVFHNLLSYMLVEADHILTCTHLLFVIKNLERIGDQATNIAETIQFLVAGTNMTYKRQGWPNTNAAASPTDTFNVVGGPQ
jgi:phosphate transport system protein